MRPQLLHRAGDPEPIPDGDEPRPPHEAALVADLGIPDVLRAMARGDDLIADVAGHTLLRGLTDPAAIAYRQQALRDALAHPEVVRELYGLAVTAIEHERAVYIGLVSRPTSVLQRSIDVLELTVDVLRRLRALADRQGRQLGSEAFTTLFATLRDQLDDAYLATVEDQLAKLRFRDGIVVGVRLGPGGKGVDHTLREPPRRTPNLRRLLPGSRTASAVRVDDHDDAGTQALAELREQAVEDLANVLAQASQDVLGFFGRLRRELAFYVGCVNLHTQLTAIGEPVCFPEPAPAEEGAFVASGLYDPGLSLRAGQRAVGNDVVADGVPLVLVTGANQGGKSTFLRSVGLAQLMMQAGMFVAADAFRSSVTPKVLSHFEREEDATMHSGRLDAELREMSAIVDRVAPGDLLLCNESFGSTNEREGSLLAHDIIRALTEAGVRVVFVTHLFDLAETLYRTHGDRVCFLRAERQDDGRRTFRLLEGAPLATSYGQDLYDRVFSSDDAGADDLIVEDRSG
jgi:hypothetical protein